MKKLFFLTLFIGFDYGSVFAQTRTYKIKKDASKVEFRATGNPGFLRINGTGGKADGSLVYDEKLKKISGKIHVELDNFTTGMQLRDRHMKEKYLEIKKYPLAILVLEKADLVLENDVVEAVVKGKLNLHGVEKTIEIDVNLNQANSTTPHLRSKMNIVLDEFNIGIPSFAGVTVAKNVEGVVELDSEKATH